MYVCVCVVSNLPHQPLNRDGEDTKDIYIPYMYKQ